MKAKAVTCNVGPLIHLHKSFGILETQFLIQRVATPLFSATETRVLTSNNLI